LSPDNRQAFSSFLKNVAHLPETLRVSLEDISTPETRTSLKTMVDNLAQAAEGIKNATAAINDIRGDLYNEGRAAIVQVRQTAAVTANLAADARKLAQHVDELVKQANRLAGSANDVLGENRDDLNRLLANLAETSRHLKETVNTLKNDPSTLVWGTALPEKEIPDK
jgi:ABC-type transporter Mla subunit MlaD